jgi:hypothetical protein
MVMGSMKGRAPPNLMLRNVALLVPVAGKLKRCSLTDGTRPLVVSPQDFFWKLSQRWHIAVATLLASSAYAQLVPPLRNTSATGSTRFAETT